MGGIVVKDNVRYTSKDAERIDATPVKTKVAIEGTDAWAEEQHAAAVAAQQAELDGIRADFEKKLEDDRAAFDAQLAERRAELEREFAERTSAAAAGNGTEETDNTTTKVVEPEVTKDRKPSTTKSRTAGSE